MASNELIRVKNSLGCKTEKKVYARKTSVKMSSMKWKGRLYLPPFFLFFFFPFAIAIQFINVWCNIVTLIEDRRKGKNEFILLHNNCLPLFKRKLLPLSMFTLKTLEDEHLFNMTSVFTAAVLAQKHQFPWVKAFVEGRNNTKRKWTDSFFEVILKKHRKINIPLKLTTWTEVE